MMNTPRYALIDVEVGLKDHKIHDIGALRDDNAVYHKASKKELFEFLNDVDYICGHNIIHHDAKYLFADEPCHWQLVVTLYLLRGKQTFCAFLPVTNANTYFRPAANLSLFRNRLPDCSSAR